VIYDSVRAGGVSLYMLDLYFTLVMSLKGIIWRPKNH
jgi:hypothetical protein